MTRMMFTRKARWATLAVTAMLVAGMAGSAKADLITFVGMDFSANSGDPRPNAVDAAASYDAAAALIEPQGLITFEFTPLGLFSGLSMGDGVAIATNTDTASIRDKPAGQPDRLFGYNTTVGGERFLMVDISPTGTLTFNFSKAIQSFGLYISGLQGLTNELRFNDGTSRSIAIPYGGIRGGVAFVGFVDAGASITSVTIVGGSGTDRVGIDDVRFGLGTQAVPEPASLILALSAAGGVATIAFASRRRRAEDGPGR